MDVKIVEKRVKMCVTMKTRVPVMIMRVMRKKMVEDKYDFDVLNDKVL